MGGVHLSDEKEGFRQYFHDTFADTVKTLHPGPDDGKTYVFFQSSSASPSLYAIEDQHPDLSEGRNMSGYVDYMEGSMYFYGRPAQEDVCRAIDQFVGKNVVLFLLCRRWVGEHLKFFYEASAIIVEAQPTHYKLQLLPASSLPRPVPMRAQSPMLPTPPLNFGASPQAQYQGHNVAIPTAYPQGPPARYPLPPNAYALQTTYAPTPQTNLTNSNESCSCSMGWFMFAIGFLFPPFWLIGMALAACSPSVNNKRAALACSLALIIYLIVILPFYISRSSS